MNLVSNAAVYLDTPAVSSSQQNSTGGSSDLLGELGDFMGAPVASQPSSTSSSQSLQSTQQVRGPSRQTKSGIQHVPLFLKVKQNTLPLQTIDDIPILIVDVFCWIYFQNGESDINLFQESEKPQDKSTKDSIMALFGSSSNQQPQQQFGVPGLSPFIVTNSLWIHLHALDM